MDRCALFVDAGYLLADGAMAVHGTRHRETVSWDFGGLLQLLGNLARERTGMALLRCYWYEATVEGRRSPEHEALADLPGLKLRLGRIRPGRREGVDTEIHRDLMTLARNSAVADAVIVSGDEDLAQVVSDAQDLGMRVTVVHVAVDGNWTISRTLRQECDDLIEIGAGHLRPYVNLLSGVESTAGTPLPSALPSALSPVSATSSGASPLPLPPSPLSNGHGNSGHAGLGPLQTAAHNGPPPASPITGQPPAAAPTMTGGLGSGLGSGLGTGPMPVQGMNGYGASPGPAAPPSPSPLQAPTPGPSDPYPSQAGPSDLYPSQAGPSDLYPSQAGPSDLYPAQAAAPMQPSTTTGAQFTSPLSSAPALPASAATGPTPMPTPMSPPGQPTGPYTGPQQIAPLPAQQQSTPTLSDAVKAAHQEGQDFGESVARDAPALWLEAVLARKPRMPSDLEARLLQGSSLPIDFLLHDEVRHALRRGFWDALERSRR